MKKWPFLTVSVVLAACGTPEFSTDLNPEGAPVVTSVFVPSESVGESPTYCSTDAEVKKPAACPGDAVAAVGDAMPLGWYVRIVFDELLDPSIEEFLEDGSPSIATANPVTVTCDGVEVLYDGYYDPTGNHLTSPPGPSLVIIPAAFPAAGTGAACVVALNTIADKQGETASLADTLAFTVAPFAVQGAVPADASTEVDPATPISVTFNSYPNLTSFDGLVTLTSSGPEDITLALSAEDPATVLIQPTAGLADMTTYTVLVAAGATDLYGGALQADFTFSFTTGVAVPADAGVTPDATEETIDAGTPDADVGADAEVEVPDAA